MKKTPKKKKVFLKEEKKKGGPTLKNRLENQDRIKEQKERDK